MTVRPDLPQPFGASSLSNGEMRQPENIQRRVCEH
jgi:hypothetical protein